MTTAIPTYVRGYVSSYYTDDTAQHAVLQTPDVKASHPAKAACGRTVYADDTPFDPAAGAVARPCRRCDKSVANALTRASLEATYGRQRPRVSAAHVSRTLAQTPGLEKARWIRSGRVKGWDNWVPGFEVTIEREQRGHQTVWHYERRSGDRWSSTRPRMVATGRVIVTWNLGSWAKEAPAGGVERHQKCLAKCRDALAATGYAVEVDGARLIVTRR